MTVLKIFTAKNAKKRIERKKTGVIASEAKQSSDFSVAHIFWIASSLRSSQ